MARRRADPGIRHLEGFLARLGFQLVEHGCCGVRLSGQLGGRGALHRIVDRQQHFSCFHRLAFMGGDSRHRTGDVRINADVLARRLIAFGNAFSVQTVRVRIGRRVEDRWLRGWLHAVHVGGRHTRDET
jgi:hypothetical protein